MISLSVIIGRQVSGPNGDEAPHVALLRSAKLDAAAIDRFYSRFCRHVPFDAGYQALFRSILDNMVANSRDATGLKAMIPEIHRRLRSRLGHDMPLRVAEKMLGVEEDYLIAR
jgi:hypothetical protein